MFSVLFMVHRLHISSNLPYHILSISYLLKYIHTLCVVDDSYMSVGRIDLKHPEKMALDIRSHLLQKEERRLETYIHTYIHLYIQCLQTL